MDWIKKHADTVILMITIITSLLTSVMWMNTKFTELEKDILVIKTVLIIKGVMPIELAKAGE
jgi:hypothetical protein